MPQELIDQNLMKFCGHLIQYKIAWEKWIESEEGQKAKEGSASGQYLENRLFRAFMAGRKEIEQKI